MYTVLIVEDEEILRNAYQHVFRLEKFKVAVASNGQEALDQLKKITPDIIVLDILMPVMSGISFLEQANLQKKFPKTKVLVLSNLSDKPTVERVLSLGATRHVIKSSFSPGQLVAQVRRLLEA